MPYVNALDPTTPAGTDLVKFGDDNIRTKTAAIRERLASVFVDVDANPLIIKSGTRAQAGFIIGPSDPGGTQALRVNGTAYVHGILTADQVNAGSVLYPDQTVPLNPSWTTYVVNGTWNLQYDDGAPPTEIVFTIDSAGNTEINGVVTSLVRFVAPQLIINGDPGGTEPARINGALRVNGNVLGVVDAYVSRVVSSSSITGQSVFILQQSGASPYLARLVMGSDGTGYRFGFYVRVAGVDTLVGSYGDDLDWRFNSATVTNNLRVTAGSVIIGADPGGTDLLRVNSGITANGNITFAANNLVLRGTKTTGGAAAVNLLRLTNHANNITRFIAGVDAGGFQWTDQAEANSWIDLTASTFLVRAIVAGTAGIRSYNSAGTIAYLQLSNTNGQITYANDDASKSWILGAGGALHDTTFIFYDATAAAIRGYIDTTGRLNWNQDIIGAATIKGVKFTSSGNNSATVEGDGTFSPPMTPVIALPAVANAIFLITLITDAYGSVLIYANVGSTGATAAGAVIANTAASWSISFSGRTLSVGIAGSNTGGAVGATVSYTRIQ